MGVGDVAERGQGVHQRAEILARDAHGVACAAVGGVAARLAVIIRAVDAARLDPAVILRDEVVEPGDGLVKLGRLDGGVGGVDDLVGVDGLAAGVRRVGHGVVCGKPARAVFILGGHHHSGGGRGSRLGIGIVGGTLRFEVGGGAAGAERKRHYDGKQQRKELFHVEPPL